MKLPKFIYHNSISKKLDTLAVLCTKTTILKIKPTKCKKETPALESSSVLKNDVRGENRGEIRGELRGEMRGEMRGEVRGKYQRMESSINDKIQCNSYTPAV